MPKPPSIAASSSEPALSEYVKFTPRTVHRRELRNAPYNPRVISDAARKKLRANLRRVGLIEPPVWNRRTGNIVGGHQRVSQLDALHGHDNYLLPVAEVDLDDRTEREQNVFLNNGEAQGEFDLDKLAALYKEGVDFEHAGFDAADVYQLFGAPPSEELTDELVDKVSDSIREGTKRLEELATRAAQKNPLDFYLVVVFKDDAARDAFTGRLGLPENRYVDGRKLLDLLAPEPEGEGEPGAPREATLSPDPAADRGPKPEGPDAPQA